MIPDHLAGELLAAEEARRPLELFTARFDAFAWSDAREVARAVDRRRSAGGDTLVGYKLGWTAAAMRQALGIAEPNWGTMWAGQRLDGNLDLDTLLEAKVEPELVCRVGADLPADATMEEVAAACSEWTVGLEVVSPRFGTFAFEFLDNTADNSSAAAHAIGPWARCANPAGVTVEMSDGHRVHTGRGAAAMGSPVVAVHWLVGALAAEHERVRAGQIVFTGGLTNPFDLETGMTVTASAAELDRSVRLHCTGAKPTGEQPLTV